MRNKRETLDERDALVERFREFIRFGYVTGSEVARRISRGVSELRRYRAEARFSRRGIKGVEMARHNECNRLVKHRLDSVAAGSRRS